MMTDPKRIAKGLYWDRALTLVPGCTPVSEGCRNCWGAAEAHMRGQQTNPKIQAIYGGLTTPSGKWNGQVRFLHERLEGPKHRRVPTVYSIWMDLFHPDVQPIWIALTLQMMRDCPQHTFLVLTKRPEVALEHFTQNTMLMDALPKNVWLGVTAENQEQADKRIPILLEIPAAVRFVSVEPMLGPVDLMPYIGRYCYCGFSDDACDDWKEGNRCRYAPPRLNWVICGGETGPGARPMDLAWARSLVEQCKSASVPVFVKQLGIGQPRNLQEWPSELRVREFPRGQNYASGP